MAQARIWVTVLVPSAADVLAGGLVAKSYLPTMTCLPLPHNGLTPYASLCGLLLDHLDDEGKIRDFGLVQNLLNILEDLFFGCMVFLVDGGASISDVGHVFEPDSPATPPIPPLDRMEKELG
jgi:hypothetical protein